MYFPIYFRSKYEKFQNQHDESDDEKDSLKLDESRKFPRSAMKRLKTGKTVKTTKIGPDGKPESAFVCVSDDDSIGSASDLKARINDEFEDYGGPGRGAGVDRGGEDVSETVSSSVYHAECESVTTHEEDPRVTGTTDPAVTSKRGPKPSRASIRARAHAKLELEKKKTANPDRLLGHEYGEKPLLLDDELDSEGEYEKDRNEESTNLYKENRTENTTPDSASLINLQSPPPLSSCTTTTEYLTPSAPPLAAEDDASEDDVFALAPFKKPIQKLAFIFHNNVNINSQPRQLGGSTLEETGLLFAAGPETAAERSDIVIPDLLRRPVQSHIIYEESPSEEFPIYENVTLNSSCTIPETMESHLVYNRTDNSTNQSLHNNPFTNPFFHASQVSEVNTTLSSSDQQRPSSTKDFMSQSVDSLTFSQPAPPVNLIKVSSHSSTDLFGSTPFSCVDYDKKGVSLIPKDNTTVVLCNKAPVSALTSLSPPVTPKPKTSHYYSPPADSSVPYHAITSTPRNVKANESPVSATFDEDVDDEDLFGSVPFKPIFGNSQRSFLSLKSRTLPANMSSTFQNQINNTGKEETSHTPTEIFKASKTSKKITPPSFRKPRLTHQILSSDSESSSDSAGSGNSFTLGAASSKKSKNRDRSKDRLKYKNIKDEFEEENTMVLPMKQFTLSKKEKHPKKVKKEKVDKVDKKIEKLDKKAEKKQEKADKKSEKVEKKADKSDKKSEKAEKKAEKIEKKSDKLDKSKGERKLDKTQNYESAGISNMSFEDQSVADDQRNRLTGTASRNSVGSPEDSEDAADLRTTGGNRFGSLKRGMNPFTKLSNRI